MKPSKIWVVKLGGSLYAAPTLPLWLKALANGGGEIVVVPGGGPFADQVRAAQIRWRFDDATGHRMAMLGMAQFGLMLAGLQTRLALASDEAAMTRAIDEGKVPVWIPTSDWPCFDPPRNWSVTSDSLALWLVSRLGARGLILVKSVALSSPWMRAAELTRRGLLDAAFAHRLANARCPCRILYAGDHDALAAALQDNVEAVGTMVVA
ncbi:MAG: amino acid kinase [Pseudomonadota bacterium]|nr:amino acid kinase [Pseudomonadota bacterium]